MNDPVPSAPEARNATDLPSAEAGHVFRALAALRSACVLYPEDHPAIAAQVDDVYRYALALVADQPQVRLDIIRGILNCNGEPLPRESQVHARVLSEFAALGIDSVHIGSGIRKDEIRAVGQFLAHEHRGPGTGAPVVEVLA